MATVNDLAALLLHRTGFEVVDARPTPNQLRIVGRVPPNASSQWVLIVHRLLTVSEKAGWSVDISRHYFLRAAGNQKKLFYAWRLIFQAQDIALYLNDVMEIINSAPRPARVELQEFPLSGHSRNHGNGKGAYTAETTPMVAHIASSARMGGAR